ncbi:MAG TPA: YceI family protein [Rhodanobacteraceae bacterium]|nr:YceI family protein [Rhodanobacteraceae bacterium]
MTFGNNALSCLVLPLLAVCGAATAATVHYKIDPQHTYPSFEADHFGGLSTWRGKFNHTRGSVALDRSAGTGTVDITVDMDSVDFGLDSLNKIARGPQLFDTAKYPTATYTGRLAGFVDGSPTRVDGKLTLHGVTRPLTLKIDSFKCVPDPDPRYKRERCGADALASFDRDDYGMPSGKDYGFRMGVTLRIQVEAVAVK